MRYHRLHNKTHQLDLFIDNNLLYSIQNPHEMICDILKKLVSTA
jgi:hypothetical protein